MQRHLAIVLGDSLMGDDTAATTRLSVPGAPGGAFIWSSWLDLAKRTSATPDPEAAWAPMSAQLDEALTGPDVSFGLAVRRAAALRCSPAVGANTYHVLKVAAEGAIAGGESGPASFYPDAGAGSAWAVLEAQLTDALAALRAMGGTVHLDRVLWISASAAASTSTDPRAALDEARDVRYLLQRLALRLELNSPAPLSTVYFGETPASEGVTFNMDEQKRQVAITASNYEFAGVTDTRDYRRRDDLHWTGDSIIELGQAMAQVPFVPFRGPTIHATA